MSRLFYLWLLISLAAHIIFFATVRYPALAARAVTGSKPELMQVFLVAPPVTPQDRTVVVIPPKPIPPPIRLNEALPRSNQPTPGLLRSPYRGMTGAIGTTHPDVRTARIGRPAAAPRMMTSLTGQGVVPTGTANGTGTQASGPDTGDSGGPTYGATVQGYLPRPRYSKDDANLQYEGTVVISVAFNASGQVTSAEFSKKCPYKSLNANALAAARKIHNYKAGMIHGMASGGSDTLTYTFKDGQVFVKSSLGE
jgi:TonB family protein